MSAVGGTSDHVAVRPLRWATVVGAVSAGVLIAAYLVAWAAFGTPLAFLRPADDAYYYFDVASHVVHHNSFSTDGIHATNGFHPLWLLVLLPFAAIFEAPSQGLVVCAQLLSCVCFGFAVAGIAATARRTVVHPFAAALGALALFLPKWRGIVEAIVEGGLALALLAWMAYAAQRLRDRVDTGIARPRDAGLFGLLAGLSLLARLDTVWVVGCVCLAVSYWVLRRADSTRTNAPLLAGIALGIPTVLLGSYMLIDLAATGHVIPVSGQIKSTFPSPHLSIGYLRQFPFEYGLLVCATLGLLVAAVRRHRLFGLLLPVTLGAAVQGAYVMLFMPVAVFWWYFVSLLPAGLLGIAVMIDEVMSSPLLREQRTATTRVVGAAAAVVLAVPLLVSLTQKTPDDEYVANTGWRIEAQKAGRWVAGNLPADARLSMVDSGAFGYYSPQDVMNLDGVSSSYAYHDVVCRGHLVDELRRTHVGFFASHAVDPSYDTFTKSVPCWPDGAGAEITVDRTAEVYRSHPYVHGGRTVVFVIWTMAAAPVRE